MNEGWIAGKFMLAVAGGRKTRDGFTYRGLGLSVETEEPRTWTLTHIGTGQRLAEIFDCTEAEALRAAGQIAECGFWEWAPFYDGRKNVDHRLFHNFARVCRALPECVRMTVRLA